MATSLKQEAGNSLDLVDVKEIRGDVVILKDGSLRQIVMVGGVNFVLKSETEQNLMVQAYQNFLNAIDFSLQILVHSRKVNIENYLTGLVARKDNEASPLLQSQIEEYAAFIRGFIEKNAIMEKTFLVVVPFFPTAGMQGTVQAASGLMSLFGGGKKDKKSTDDHKTESDAEADRVFRENVAQLNQRTGQVVSGILGIGLEATTLANEELTELYYNFYNPQTIERQKMNLTQEKMTN
jgi:type IV secretory pathway VirB4 component